MERRDGGVTEDLDVPVNVIITKVGARVSMQSPLASLDTARLLASVLAEMLMRVEESA